MNHYQMIADLEGKEVQGPSGEWCLVKDGKVHVKGILPGAHLLTQYQPMTIWRWYHSARKPVKKYEQTLSP